MATTMHITLIIHHRGRLERGLDDKLCYAESEITEVERVNVDTLNGFFISDLLKDIGYPIISDFYWRQPGMEIEGGLRLLRLDMEVVKMYETAVENGHKIELNTEHPISQADVVDTNEEAGVEAPDQVNVTPSRRRRKVYVRRTPTPKKAIGPRRILHLERVHTEAQITEETHGTEKAQLDASPNPSVPTTLNTVHVSEESATPNTVSAPSIPLDNNAQPKSPTYTKPPSTSDDPQDELLTQYVPLPQNQPSFRAMPEPHPTPPPNTPSTNPSATVNAPKTQNNNTEEGIGGSRRKQIRRSTKRPLSTGQTFIPNTDPNQPSSVFIPVEGGEYSDDKPGLHCYESEGLYSIGSDEDD
ncbi:uncharacterized protein DS421_1g28240 [Arachis hypogaea]|nr:uncharacterized protein DS421_1g28240 [Arachis hypogaea]